MSKSLRFVLLFLPFFVFSCAEKANTTLVSYKQITVGKGPEDLLLDSTSSEPRLIISCGDFRNGNNESRKGGIYSYNLLSEAATRFTDDLPDSIELFPHGISLLPGNPSHLYVINHSRDNDDKKHAVLVFKIIGDSLYLEKVIKNPKYLTSPNDLSVLPDGSFYITNTGPFTIGSFIARLFTHPSNVTYYNMKTSSFEVVLDRIEVANGIQVIGEKVYVADSFTKKLHVLTRAQDGTLKPDRKISIANNMDNLSWDVANHKLYIASHHSALKLNKSKSDSTQHSGFEVHSIDLNNGEISAVMNNDGSLISGVSTALVYGDYLYLSQIFGNYIERVKL